MASGFPAPCLSDNGYLLLSSPELFWCLNEGSWLEAEFAHIQDLNLCWHVATQREMRAGGLPPSFSVLSGNFWGYYTQRLRGSCMIGPTAVVSLVTHFCLTTPSPLLGFPATLSQNKLLAVQTHVSGSAFWRDLKLTVTMIHLEHGFVIYRLSNFGQVTWPPVIQLSSSLKKRYQEELCSSS